MPINPKLSAHILSLNLRSHRDMSDKTQAEIAEKCGLSLRLYQDLEAGKGNPTLETLCRLAQVYRISTDRLLRLDRVRGSNPAERFVELYQKNLQKLNCGAGLRTLDGVLIWANPYMETLLGGYDFHSGPVDLLAMYPPAGREALRLQFASEKNGLLATYTNPILSKSGELVNLRGYPTLILPAVGKESILTSLYLSEVHRDCHENYFSYCEQFLKCL